MATFVLSAVGTAIGGPIGGAIGSMVGSYIDAYLIQSLMGPMKQEGPRLDNLKVQGSTEGAPIPEVAGGVRIAGQLIWATKLKEVVSTDEVGGKGGGGGGVEVTNYTYFGNFAVGLCEGVIDRIGRIWADGKPLDQTGVTMRVYRGTTDQLPDPLIEGVEGAGKTPAYRRLAYVVFDNMPLAKFGNRFPQLTFEVFRKVGDEQSLEDLATAVTVIPGAGERVYDTVVQRRYYTASQTPPENNASGRPDADFIVAMDDLEASLPNVNTVLLVVGWFGDDLRCGSCTIRPKVEVQDKITAPDDWHVHGQDRISTPEVSKIDGTPAYGGSPSDDSVVRAIRDLKARGYNVVIYPFLFMDVASGNALPNPYGGTGQPAYPWRGRITCDPAVGVSGTVDKTATAATQVASFFGTVAASEITVSVDSTSSAVTTNYTGPAEWSYRRFILHYAKLAAAINALDPGAVDGILIGSEMRELAKVRSSSSAFPTVTQLVTLAADVKGVVGGTVKVSYAADWSDYNGYKAADGSNDFYCHYDPLWASSDIDFVGIDNYVPLSDWRDGTGHLDAAAGAPSIYDPDYLASNVEGGECYDWFYASDADRNNQVRTPITDGAYSKPWMFRAKDFKNWWLNLHRNRPAGVQTGVNTAWVPESKPIWFTEFGIPSVDRGTNQPNVFYDPKSSESLLPYYSRGRRDDLIQRRGLEAVLRYWADPAKNPTSSVYGAPMIGNIALWTWDARPFPAWPSRGDIWADGALWPLGHWMKGKIGFGDLAKLVEERCARVNFTAIDVSSLNGIVSGYLRDRPMSPRAEIEALMAAFAFDAVESDGILRFVARGQAPVATFTVDDCIASEEGEDAITLTRDDDKPLPDVITVTFTDVNKEYQSGAVSRSRVAGYSERVANTQLPLVLDDTMVQGIASRTMAEIWIARDTAKFALPPSALALEPTDVVDLVIAGQSRSFQLGRVTDAGVRQMDAMRTEGALYGPVLPGTKLPIINVPPVYGPAVLHFLDLPMLSDSATPHAFYGAATATPWGGVTIMDSTTGALFAVDTQLAARATIGVTVQPFSGGHPDRWDRGNKLTVELYYGQLSSAAEAEVLAGANALAIQNTDGDWEIVQFVTATLISPNVYELTQLLRGQLGTEQAMRSPLAVGAPVVLLNNAVAQLNVSLTERGVPRFYKWGSSQLPSTDGTWQTMTYTAQAVGLMPWSPVHLSGSRDGSDNLAISWIRRTRVSGDTWAAGEVPLNEEAEAYEVDILNGANVVRTLSSPTPSVIYTAAQQTTDFGSPQSAVDVVIYQMSAAVGRGRPAKKTV